MHNAQHNLGISTVFNLCWLTSVFLTNFYFTSYLNLPRHDRKLWRQGTIVAESSVLAARLGQLIMSFSTMLNPGENNTWDWRPILEPPPRKPSTSAAPSRSFPTLMDQPLFGDKHPFIRSSPQVPQKAWQCRWIFKSFHRCSSWTATMSWAFLAIFHHTIS